MNRLGVRVIAFRFGFSASEVLSVAALDASMEAARLITDQRCELLDQSVQTVAIDNATMDKNPEFAYTEFFARLRSTAAFPDIVVVDLLQGLSTAPRVVPMIHLACAIDAACNDPHPPKFVVTVDTLSRNDDPVLKILQERISNGHVTLLSRDGSSRAATQLTPAQAFKLKVRALSASSLDRLETKLVRRLGHFMRRMDSGKHYRCARFFYDAGACIEELIDLLESFVREKFGASSKPVIVYDAPVSDWFVEFILSYEARTGAKVYRYDAFARASMDNQGEHLLLIVPMVQSGHRLIQILSSLKEWGKAASLTILTVLTDRTDSAEAKFRLLTHSGAQWQIHYFLLVAMESSHPENCRLCQLRVPESPPNQPCRPLLLRTIDFWDMVYDAGWKLEENVPAYRDTIGYVPNLPALVERNGPWLSTKIRALIATLPTGYPEDLVIVCPLEPGSIVLGELLKAFLEKITVVFIPRSLIDICRTEDQPDLSQYATNRPDWFVQLSTLASEDALVMDEFNASGGTRRGLTRLLHMFGKRTSCYFSILDLNPTESQRAPGLSYSLYSFQAYEAAPR